MNEQREYRAFGGCTQREKRFTALPRWMMSQLKNKKIPKKETGFRVCLYCTYSANVPLRTSTTEYYLEG